MRQILSKFIFSLFLASLPMMGVYAAAGCCSHHGGITGCNTATNHSMCKDGTSSPTCLCDGGKTNAMKTKKTTTHHKENTMTTNPATEVTAPAATATTAGTVAATMPAHAKKASTKGCCARHGGVASCDITSGFQMCKDGTRSTTCKCS